MGAQIRTDHGQKFTEIYERIGPNLTLVGISTKWWSRSPDAKCTCGVPLTAKARFSKFSFSPNATRSRHCGCSANSFVTRVRSDGYRHRQAEILRDGASRNWLLGFASRTARQQPRGELASAGSTTRTKDARLQISQICSALRFGPCGRLQHVQCSTAFDEPSDASTVSNRRASILERCDSRGSIN